MVVCIVYICYVEYFVNLVKIGLYLLLKKFILKENLVLNLNVFKRVLDVFNWI